MLTTTYNARGLFEGMGGIDTYVSSTSYTATGGIDQQVLGSGVFNDFTYDATSNRLERIYIPVYTGTSPASWRWSTSPMSTIWEATSQASTTACGRKSAPTSTTSSTG